MKDFMGSLSRLILGVACMVLLTGTIFVGSGIAVPKEAITRLNSNFELELNKVLKPSEGEIGLLLKGDDGKKRIIWRSERNLKISKNEKIEFLIFASGSFPTDTAKEYIYPLVCMDKEKEYHITFVVSKAKEFRLKDWEKLLIKEGICPAKDTFYQIKPVD